MLFLQGLLNLFLKQDGRVQRIEDGVLQVINQSKISKVSCLHLDIFEYNEQYITLHSM